MKFLLFSLVVIVSFSSCVQKRFLHHAAPVLNPMLKEKGEGFAAGYYHTNGSSTTTVGNDLAYDTKSNGLHFQGGFAVTGHFALVGSFNYLNQESNSTDLNANPFDTSAVNYNRTEFTVAGSYFHINETKKAGINILAGITTGKLKIDDAGRLSNADYYRHFNANLLSIFLQPCFNIYLQKNSAIGFHTKASMLSYNNSKTNYTASELSALKLKGTSSIFTTEIGSKLSIGLNNIPLSLDAQFNFILSNSSNTNMKRTNFSTGVTYRFQKK